MSLTKSRVRGAAVRAHGAEHVSQPGDVARGAAGHPGLLPPLADARPHAAGQVPQQAQDRRGEGPRPALLPSQGLRDRGLGGHQRVLGLPGHGHRDQ